MLKNRILRELTARAGKSRAIGMGELYELVYNEGYTERINGTRTLRALIYELQSEGVPVLSTVARAGGGYYIPSSHSDLKDYCFRLRKQGLKKLAKEARLRKLSLPSLLHEIQLTLEYEIEEKKEEA
jgi:hypothetical protein